FRTQCRSCAQLGSGATGGSLRMEALRRCDGAARSGRQLPVWADAARLFRRSEQYAAQGSGPSFPWAWLWRRCAWVLVGAATACAVGSQSFPSIYPRAIHSDAAMLMLTTARAIQRVMG